MNNLNFQIPPRWRSVTPSDSTDVSGTVALYVGVTGNVAVTTEGGDSVTFVAVPAGTVIPGRFTKVMSTGTTSSSILRASLN